MKPGAVHYARPEVLEDELRRSWPPARSSAKERLVEAPRIVMRAAERSALAADVASRQRMFGISAHFDDIVVVEIHHHTTSR